MQAIQNKVAQSLKDYFASKKISQKEIAETIGIKQPVVALLLNGQRKLSNSNMLRLYQYYDIDPLFMLTGEGEITRKSNAKTTINVRKSGNVEMHDEAQFAQGNISNCNEQLTAQIIRVCDEQGAEIKRLLTLIEKLSDALTTENK